MKKIFFTIAGLLAFGIASAQTDTTGTVIKRPQMGTTVSPATTSPSVNPVNTRPQSAAQPGNQMVNPQTTPAPTTPPNTTGVPVTPGSPAIGPVTTPTTTPTPSGINPGVPQRP